MSEAKHTPGPWHTENGRNVRTVNGDGAIADVYDGQRGLHVDDAATEANTRLIVAAPDLLALLQSMCDAPFIVGTSVNDEIRAAIAKATGTA